MAQRGSGGAEAIEPLRSEPPSIIAADLNIIGNIQCDGAVHIDGVVEGDIACDSLTIGARGRVKGHVSARHVEVYGTMNGSIHAKRAIITEGARVVGDVIHEALVVEWGARLEGYCRSAVNVDTSGAVDVRDRIGNTLPKPKPPDQAAVLSAHEPRDRSPAAPPRQTAEI